MTDKNITAGQKRGIAADDDDSSSNLSTSPEPQAKKNRLYFGDYTKPNSEITMDGDDIKSNFHLIISNLPEGWTCDEVMNYVREEIGETALLVNDFRDSESDFQIRLKFKTEEQRNNVLEKLKTKQALGLVCVDTTELTSDEGSPKTDMEIENRDVKGQDVEMNINIDVWDVDPKTLYGLKESFLTSLDITPPLSNWVVVRNFRCDRSELKEVMELAGHVLVCHVVTIAKRYANVMYSHPLEAVQAISMLNGQTYYGQTLKITMDNQSEYWKILPKGLANLGPGLGRYGKPVRNIAKQYERFISGKSTLIETKIFKSDNSSDLLREIILPSMSRPESTSNGTPELVIDTQINNEHKVKDELVINNQINNENKVKDESPLENVDNNDSPADLESTEKSTDSETTKKVDSPSSDRTIENTNDTHTDNNNDNAVSKSNANNKPITNFGQNSATNNQMVQPLVNTQSRFNVGPVPTATSMQITRNVGFHVRMQGPQAMQSVQGMHRMQAPQAMQSVQGMQRMQAPQVMQRMQAPQVMQRMQAPQAMQSMQGVQRMQGPQAMQGVQGMRGLQRPMGNMGMQNAFQQNYGQFANNQAFRPNQGLNQYGQYSNSMSGNGFPNSNNQGMQGPVMQPNRPMGSVGPFQQQSVRPLEVYRGINAFSLKIVNIPPMVKLSGLCDKLSEFGLVTGLEFDGPGCAMVKFDSAADAERCFRNYRQVFQY